MSFAFLRGRDSGSNVLSKANRKAEHPHCCQPFGRGLSTTQISAQSECLDNDFRHSRRHILSDDVKNAVPCDDSTLPGCQLTQRGTWIFFWSEYLSGVFWTGFVI